METVAFSNKHKKNKVISQLDTAAIKTKSLIQIHFWCFIDSDLSFSIKAVTKSGFYHLKEMKRLSRQVFQKVVTAYKVGEEMVATSCYKISYVLVFFCPAMQTDTIEDGWLLHGHESYILFLSLTWVYMYVFCSIWEATCSHFKKNTKKVTA